MNKNITAIVFTFNEERRLPYVYENLKDFCEIIVFDGGSTDGTREYCNKNNIKFIIRPEETYETRPNGLFWAMKQSPTEYVLHVICSHFYPKELLNRFSDIANENKLSAVYHDVIVYRYGEVVHRPIVRRIPSGCNFYKKNIINFDASKIHAEMGFQFDENSMVRLEARDELSLHLFQDEDCKSYTEKTLRYVVTDANQQFRAGRKVGFIQLAFNPLFRFFYNYFRTGAFMRGSSGLVYSILNMINDYQTNIIIWELCNDLTLKDVYKKNGYVRSKLIQSFHDEKI